MKSPGRDSVLAREMIMVGMDDKELIKKYHLEDADFIKRVYLIRYQILSVSSGYRR